MADNKSCVCLVSAKEVLADVSSVIGRLAGPMSHDCASETTRAPASELHQNIKRVALQI